MNTQPGAVHLYINLMKKALTASIYSESAWSTIEAEAKKETPTFSLQKIRDFFRYSLVKALAKKSVMLIRKTPFDAAARDEGKDWPLFGFTMIGNQRLDNIQACFDSVLADEVAGDLVETGSWRGGTTIFMRALLKAHGVTDRKVWVADSFEGLPVPKDQGDGWDLSEVDFLKVSLEQVRSNFEKFDLLDDQVEFLKGWFCDTLPSAPIKEISILRLDGDLYSSTMDSLENLYHKVSTGGYIIVDDYHSWPACRRAVTDFRANNGIESEIITIDWTGAYWRKN